MKNKKQQEEETEDSMYVSASCPLMSLRCPPSPICLCADSHTCTEPAKGHLDTHTHVYAMVQKHMLPSIHMTYTQPDQPPDFSGCTLEAAVHLTDNHSSVTYKTKR